MIILGGGGGGGVYLRQGRSAGDRRIRGLEGICLLRLGEGWLPRSPSSRKFPPAVLPPFPDSFRYRRTSLDTTASRNSPQRILIKEENSARIP